MKKILFAALVLLAAVSCGPKPAVFTGKITGLKPESKVMLYDIAGRTQEIPIEVDADGNYKIEIKADPCTRYIICDDPKGGVKFFVEPGMKANIDLEFKSVGNEGGEEVWQTVVTYTGDDKDAYDFLTEGEFYQNIQNPVIMAHYEAKDLTSFDDFCKDLQMRKDSLVALLPKVQSPVFRAWMKNDYEEKVKYAYNWYPELASGPDDSYAAFLESLDRNGNLQDAETYMSGYSSFWLPKDKDRYIAWFDVLKEKITDKEIVRRLADERIDGVIRRAPANLAEVFEAYKALEPGRAVPEKIQEQYDHYIAMIPGAQAVDFDFYDVDDNKYTLSDLRGKAVYIDCWATWCGPCRAETPYMVKLYEHYRNDPRIRLVSISLDKNGKQWKAVVAEEKLAWPQYIVHGEFECALCKNYDISGIPRFLFFDAEGRILSLDARRPSDPDIIPWIESLLK
jgi:thiol-disulfide isomerase/thioredoxin